jgi:hypothetical protein
VKRYEIENLNLSENHLNMWITKGVSRVLLIDLL